MDGLRINLLGPLEMESSGVAMSVPFGKRRILLAAMAIRCGNTVDANYLIDALWDEDPPPSARTTLRGHVKRLRKFLEHFTGGSDHLIQSVSPGYALRLPTDSVDLHRFRNLWAKAVAARERAEQRTLLRAALALWRGPALADVGCEVLARDLGPAIEEERIQALHRLLELDLQEGRHHEVITASHELLALHPLQELFWQQLIRALSGSGRVAEAFEQYERVRNLLADTLGTSPGPVLQAMHRQLLRADQEAAPIGPADAQTAPIEVKSRKPTAVPLLDVPHQIPSDVGRFVGRDSELDTIGDLLDEASGAAAPLIVEGQAGIGKTATVVHWAQRNRGRFTEGQLYLNLRGFHPRDLIPPSAALAVLLRGLGVPEEAIPATTAERSALLRSRTAGRRLLVVLDNARDSAHVRPLLPAQTCSTVITSRQRLGGLVAREGASRLNIAPLNSTQSVELLAAALGRNPLDSERTAIREIIEWCAGVPLALRLLAERASRGGSVSLVEIAAALRDDETRLDLLDTSDDEISSLRGALSRSYDVLSVAQSALFRLLGTQPALVIDVDLAARLTRIGRQDAGRLLEGLVAVRLVDPVGRTRYRLPPLTHSFAAELAQAESGQAVVSAGGPDWPVGVASRGPLSLLAAPLAFHAEPASPGRHSTPTGDLWR